MSKTNVHVIEVVEDAELRKKEGKASEAVKRFFPNAGPLRLYRTAEGRIGVQLDLSVTPGDRQRLDHAYRAIMKVLGEKRGRPRGVKTVQTKLLLPEPAYRALKRAAAASHSTMSGLVAQLASGLGKAGSR
jgi:hypothetical protein